VSQKHSPIYIVYN